MDAAQLAERLASDSAEDRSAAYAVIEATQDVGLAALLAEPLAALLGRPEEEIGASELQRASLALGHLVSLDCVAVGGEFFRDDRWLARWSNEANALGRILSKPTAELTVDEVAVNHQAPTKSHPRVAAAAVVVEEVLVAPAPETLLPIPGEAAGLSLPEIRPKVVGEEPFV